MRRLTLALWTLILCYCAATGALEARAYLEPTLRRWVEGATVGSPHVVRNLAVYPIYGRQVDLPRRLSLEAALMQRTLRIQEVGGGEVNRLCLENTGERPVFLMAGEVLLGARQDRVLQHDLWLPADSGPVEVSCFCVEHGRWAYQGGDKSFKSAGVVSNARVRSAARSEAGQGAVWVSVDETSRDARVASPTQALHSVYQSPRISREVRDMVAELADLPDDHPDMTGVAAQVGTRVIAVDVFPDARMLRSMWPKLCKSYALEARSLHLELGDTTRSKVEAMLEEGSGLDASPISQPGSGQLYELHSSSLDGEALLLPEGLVHLELLSRERPTAAPVRNENRWPPAIDLVRPRHR